LRFHAEERPTTQVRGDAVDKRKVVVDSKSCDGYQAFSHSSTRALVVTFCFNDAEWRVLGSVAVKHPEVRPASHDRVREVDLQLMAHREHSNTGACDWPQVVEYLARRSNLTSSETRRIHRQHHLLDHLGEEANVMFFRIG
jgi:hypothetical protein